MIQRELSEQVKKIAKALNVIGLINTQFAIQGDEIYILEVNPELLEPSHLLPKQREFHWSKLPLDA